MSAMIDSIPDSGFPNQMASSSGDNVMGISGAMNDRFSSLPDAVAHRILSFVNVDEFVSVMLVSKRFNQLCFSAPCLLMVNKSSDDSNRAKLERFFSAYFSQRSQHGAKVQELRILWSFRRSKPLALEYGMREQNDCVQDDPVFSCLFHCATWCHPELVWLNLVLREGACLKDHKISACSLSTLAKSLVLSMNNTGVQLLPENSYSIPSRLEKLTLQSIRITCGSGFNFGSDQFPKLKRLRLFDISGMEDLQIWNNSLEHVEILINGLKGFSDLHFLTLGSSELRTLQLEWYPRSMVGRVHLNLPKLENLEWKGLPLMYSISTINKHMKRANVYCVWPFSRDFVCEDMYYSFVGHCVKSAKSLRLLARTIEIFHKQCCNMKGVPSLGAETLHIDDCYLTDCEVLGITFVLKMMPNLKNIYVSSSVAYKRVPFKSKKKEQSSFELYYWEAENLKFVQQLKTATVEIHREQGNAVELIKYFAKHGEHLQNLKVICPQTMVSAVSGQIEMVKSGALNVTYLQG